MVEYKDTLSLPKTDFSMRAGLAQKEPRMLAKWEGLYEKIQESRKDAPLFVLHDGPPYANNHLHNGHVLDKIIKDIVVKDRTMAGMRAPYVPGWDCHGLPIEVQVDKKLGKKKSGMSRVEVRQACRAYASKYVAIQREEFKRLGVLGRWDNPYQTMNFPYEAQTVRELARFAEQGLLYQGLRPVNWCTVHQTALAEAEVEYEDHRSPSIYVAFALETGQDRLGLPAERQDDIDVVIWTTTPWTLPANLAICVNPNLEYIAYDLDGRIRIFVRSRAEEFLAQVKTEGEPLTFSEDRVLGSFSGSALEGLTYKHPLFDRSSPVVLADHATDEAGTGCVHTAPGHGADDFEVGRRMGLDILSPVDDRGILTQEAGPFAGQHVFAANKDIIAALLDCGALLSDPNDEVEHRYAHCWRCSKPIILRATEQWWVAMDKPYGTGGRTLRQRALTAIDEVEWSPEWGKKRIRGMVEGRPDWCLSRQRTWGVPIPAAYCTDCGTPLVDAKLMRKVADIFQQLGADAWYTKDIDELFGPQRCGGCGGTAWRKETDILDVWFDSGVSFAAVVEQEGFGHREGPTVDVYSEGSDQHRGWFQSSLLISLATRERPPFRRVMTHGFVVDGKGKKESKRLGNFTDPFKTIKQNGAELLRLWVAAEDFRGDIRQSQEILRRQTETYRKIRNTLRYLLGNLHGFDPSTDLCAANELHALDRYALRLTATAVAKIRRAYFSTQFHQVVQTVNELCTSHLSAFYFDILKDRLYCDKRDGMPRRAAQTALFLIARDLIRVLAPILSFTADEAWGHLPRLAGDPECVHLCHYPADETHAHEPGEVVTLLQQMAGLQDGEQSTALYQRVRELRGTVNASLELARKDKTIGSSTEAKVTLSMSAALQQQLAGALPNLSSLLIVSAVEIVTDEGASSTTESVGVQISRANGTKCQRCWLYREDVGSQTQHPDICVRCTEAL